MKNIYVLFLCIAVFYSCSKDETGPDPVANPKIDLKACFTVNKDTVSVGEELHITSCSKDATTFSYQFGNGETSVEENPKIILQEGGDYNITLTVSDDKQNTDTHSHAIYVTSAESKYIYPTIPNGFIGFPLGIGIHPTNNKPYYIDVFEDYAGTEGAKFYYRELDENYIPSSNYIADKPYNTGGGFVNFLSSGNMNFHFSRTLSDFYGTQEITLNSSWDYVSSINSASKHSYGYLSVDGNFLYFGTQKEGDLYKTAIEKRNASGDAFEILLNAFGDADSMIGDMVRTSDGYIAYGGVFAKNTSAPYITLYKPLLVFLDTNLNITSHALFEDSVLDTKVSSVNDLNGSYHLEQLSNGNIVTYGNGELTVFDVTGTKISSTYFNGTKNNQALVSLGDSFIISTDGYLRKFNVYGNQTKEIKYNGNYMPGILDIDNQLFFVAGYDTTDIVEGVGNLSVVKIFYGAVDKDLNLIDLNP